MTTTNWDCIDSILQFPESDDDVFLERSGHASQIPSPPVDYHPRPVINGAFDGNEHVLISTTFSVHAEWHTVPPDLALFTSDSVFFYVHSHTILAASKNSFQSLIPITSFVEQSSNTVIHVPETSQVLNIILHLVYNLPSGQYSPTLETVSAAVNRLSSYGVHAKRHIVPHTHIYSLLLSYAPLVPTEVYTLAAKHDLFDLAVSTSAHLLSFKLHTLTDEMSEAIGPKYLRKLFFLHIGRSDALKRLLLQPPHPHGPAVDCSLEKQRALTRAWVLASAYIAWEARPDMPIGFLKASLDPLTKFLNCDLCKESLSDRIKNLVIQWSQVKGTIS